MTGKDKEILELKRQVDAISEEFKQATSNYVKAIKAEHEMCSSQLAAKEKEIAEFAEWVGSRYTHGSHIGDEILKQYRDKKNRPTTDTSRLH